MVETNWNLHSVQNGEHLKRVFGPTNTKEQAMAKNTGKGFRRGSVDNRSQFQSPNGNWAKRDTGTGRIMDQKQDGKPFKGVAKEIDDRRS